MSKNPLASEYYQLGKRIQYYRNQKGLTQEELAEKVRTSVGHLAHIESGMKTPSLKMLFKIATALSIRVEDLFKFCQANM